MEKAEKAVDFIIVPDSAKTEISTRERLEAASSFRGLCEDVFIRHMGSILGTEKGMIRPGITDVHLRYATEDGSYLSIYVYESESVGMRVLPSRCGIYIIEYGSEYNPEEEMRTPNRLHDYTVLSVVNKVTRVDSFAGEAMHANPRPVGNAEVDRLRNILELSGPNQLPYFKVDADKIQQ